MRINTQLKSTSTNHTKSDILTKGSVMLPVDWDKNWFTVYEVAPYDEYYYWLFICKDHYEQYLALWHISSLDIYIYIYISFRHV